MPNSFLVVAFLVALILPAHAQSGVDAASAWSNGSHSQMRVVAAGRTQDGGYRIGVEIRMRDGFKTYWRVPGDAGVPPSFDWSASVNVGSVSLRWPAPVRFVDAGITTIGYKDRVIFPAIVRPAEAGKGVTISLNLDYAVCDRICIPAKGQATLRLPDAAETAQTKDVAAFRERTPRLGEAGKSGGGLSLMRANVVQAQGKRQVEIAVEVPQGGLFEDAFLEGPDGWAFGAPQLVSSEGDLRIYRIPIDDKPKNVVGLVPISLTMTGAPHPAEVRFDLDFSAPRP